MGFDPITLTMAKKYTDSQRLGYSAYEKRNHIYFDGDIDGRETIPGEALEISDSYSYVYASADVFTGGQATHASWVASTGATGIAQGLRVSVSNDGIWLLFGKLGENADENLLALSFGPDIAQTLGVSAGSYVMVQEFPGGIRWMWSIVGRFTETIHTIDPKFIPGAVLPVVEFAGVDTGEITDEAIVEQLNYALENAYAIIMRLVGGGADVSTLMIKAVMPDMFTGFMMPGESLGHGTNLELKDNVWMFNA